MGLIIILMLCFTDYTIRDRDKEIVYVYLSDTSEEVFQDTAVIPDPEDTAEVLEPEPEYPIWVDNFTQLSSADGIDIVWVIDRSGSMNNNLAKLEQGIAAMFGVLNAEFDAQWRVGIVSADPSESANNSAFPLIYGDDETDAMTDLSNLGNPGREQGFSAFYEYYTGSYAPTWMRTDASLLVIFVSDEDDQSQQQFTIPQDFVNWYSTLRDNTYLASIVVTTTDCEPQLGDRYIEATNSMSGDIVDICAEDWTPSIQAVTYNLQPYDEWELSHIPIDGVAGIYIFVDGLPASDWGILWSYDAASNKVIFDPSTLPMGGSFVEIAYEWDNGGS